MNYELFTKINGFANSNEWLDIFMIFVSDNTPYIYIGLVILLFLLHERYRFTTILATLAACLAYLTNYLIQLVYFEPRPFVTHSVNLLYEHSANASFPSDHTTAAFAIALMIWMRHKKIGAVAVLFACLVGFSRVFVGHHYPFDVIAGMVVATLIVLLVNRFSIVFEPISKLVNKIYNTVINKVLRRG